MVDRLRFGEAVSALSSAFERKTDYCRPFLDVLPVSGAAISTLSAPFGTETVCASDRRAARLDELQFDLGEGPCWEAMTTGRPVIETDFRHSPRSTWPVLREAVKDDGVGAIFALPLHLGSLEIGAVDLYAEEPGELTDSQLWDALTLADIAAKLVLRRALASRDADIDADAVGASRRVVHQATGMVLAQLNVSAADALLILRGHAYSNGLTVREIAEDVVDRRLDFSAPEAESRMGI